MSKDLVQFILFKMMTPCDVPVLVGNGKIQDISFCLFFCWLLLLLLSFSGFAVFTPHFDDLCIT